MMVTPPSLILFCNFEVLRVIHTYTDGLTIVQNGNSWQLLGISCTLGIRNTNVTNAFPEEPSKRELVMVAFL